MYIVFVDSTETENWELRSEIECRVRVMVDNLWNIVGRSLNSINKITLFMWKREKASVHPDRPCHLSIFNFIDHFFTTYRLEIIIHQRPRRWSSRYAVSPAVRSLATNGRPISIYYKLIFQREMPLMNLDCVDIAAEGWWVFFCSLAYMFLWCNFLLLATILFTR